MDVKCAVHPLTRVALYTALIPSGFSIFMPMKGMLFALLLSVTFALSAQELVPVFGPLYNVTPTNASGSTRPRMALASDSIPVVTWTKTGTTSQIFAARWNGNGFDSAVQVTPSGVNVYTSTGEGGDIAARGDTVFIVFFTQTERVYIVRSIDGGITWGDTVRVDHSDPMTMAYIPDVEVMPGGNPVVVFETSDMNMQNTKMKVTRSYDGGQTWTMEQDAHIPIGMPCECCPPTLLAQDSLVCVMYRNNDNNLRNIVMSISTDSGMTFPVMSEFDQSNWMLSTCPTAGPTAAFIGDSIVTLWKSSNKIYYSTIHKTDGGETGHHLLEPSLGTVVLQRYPSAIASGDTLIYTWDDRRNVNYDAFVAITVGVQPVTTAFMFNDTVGTTENGTQQNTHVAYNNGIVHLIYQDAVSGIVKYRRATIAGVLNVPEPVTEEALITTYPNPVTDKLVLLNPDGHENCVANIFDAHGRLVSSTPMNAGQTQIDCASLVPGTYVLHVTDAEGTVFTTTITKQ